MIDIFRFDIIFSDQFDRGLYHTHGGRIGAEILESGAEDTPAAPVHRFFQINSGKKGSAVSMITLYYAHWAG